jgi:hypothetical protein
MEPTTPVAVRRSTRVTLVYLGTPGEATESVRRPRRGILAVLAEYFGVGRFGGFGWTGRLHDVGPGA